MSAPDAAHAPKTTDRTAALLPPCLFAAAIAFFVGGLATAPFIAGEAQIHFYQPHVLAVVHMLTLGWVSTVMIGVLYRYVPGLTKGRLARPRLAVAQAATFVVGVLGLVSHFWLGAWGGTAAAAGLLVASAALLCGNLWPLLLAAPRRGVAEVGVLVATAFLVAAATLGTLLALDKTWSFVPGSTLGNLGAHAHLAALGWVGVTVVALSARFLPAFLLPAVDPTPAARRVVLVLAAGVVVLATLLLLRSDLVWAAALAVAGALGAHVVLSVRVIGTRRMQLDWTARHAIASVAWCLVAALGGVAVAVLGAQEALGVRLATAYGVAGLLGWMSNLVIGVSYKLFPGFVAAARAERRRAAVPIAMLGAPAAVQPAVFVTFNAAVLATMAGLLVDRPTVTAAGAAGLSLAAALYGGTMLRTLAFAVVDPKRQRDPLPVLHQ